ncbi:MAG: beta-glucosidase [Ancylobacter novellus]|uniref:Beta-glucosidase n=1 Tax=Ancylobacter novellus TaxID=921 RepID=A0A2W5M8U1_ANCNO|nr:MAG: beta-glucosidase [Ancylobacter novellus]
MAGFECASQRRADGRRLDLIASTKHDVFAASDYALVARRGLRAARDGMRWHLIEKTAGFYDWSSVEPMAKAASHAGVQIVWDLCHYGYPDWLDVWSPAFPERFARFAKAAARFIADQGDGVPYFCPVNEMSFWAWAGGDMGRFNPCAKGRGDDLKRQLARAAIAAVDAIREVEPRARFIVAEPSIHVAPNGDSPQAIEDAANYCEVQYAAHDMLVGRLNPELGGSPDKLDIVGVNFYPDNQWVLGGPPIPLGQYNYRPFREMLAEVSARYGRPVIVSELGAENTARPAWLYYVCQEVDAARKAGASVEAMCLYPILDYPGWENDRHCEVGLFGNADESGDRRLCEPFAEELERQRLRFEGERAAANDAPAEPLRREAS